MDKRSFLKSFGVLGFASAGGRFNLQEWITLHQHLPATELAGEEDFWKGIRDGYRIKPDYINLENGYYCFQPQEILEKYIQHIREVNYQGAYYMRNMQAGNKKAMAARLARLAGCSEEELIITRNTTESLDMIIGGLNWKPGDEAVMSHQDYGAMLDMFTQISRRYGVVCNRINIPNLPASDEEIVSLYEQAITPRTRLLMVCHIVNITGQILPVRKIADMAHRKGVLVMVDGAHAFAHIRYAIPDLHCDFYGASLHKWLSVPLGAGILYVKKEHIPQVWPLIASGERPPGDISRLNHTGTHPVATDLTIADAIDFYEQLGPERKEARLRFLQQYWTSRVRHLPRVQVQTPADPARSCAIANVGIEGIKPADLASTLLQRFNIYTVAIDYAGVHGCRITPNIYTTTAELDKLVSAIRELAA
ncbi:MAG: aminotransferase class V-fold PLP-dependent enzyme [Chitinophagaceae bacterium]|nr:aminotransferase class V-fold PLP-dependent enzyme [Chitinophagaceae bacterium]